MYILDEKHGKVCSNSLLTKRFKDFAMLCKQLCQKYLKKTLVTIHAKRVNSLFETSWALSKGANLSLSSLGRSRDGNAAEKHQIKSVDRLLGNKKLYQQLPTIYKDFVYPIINCLPRLYVIVDWSGCCRNDVHMLRASLVCDGRSITFYNELHPQNKVGNAKVHKEFIRQLKKIIPQDKEVIIITDAGFSTPWFNEVLQVGWNFIGRIKRNIKLCISNTGEWISEKEMDAQATSRIKTVGTGVIGKKSVTPVRATVYSYRGTKKHRTGNSRYPEVNARYSLSNSTALVMATSLSPDEYKGREIKNIYKKRMQIEQNFRDDKSTSYGLGWRISRTKHHERISILCLIACIATFFFWWIGLMAEKNGLHKKYQANTVRNKRVLSLVYLGKRVLSRAKEELNLGKLQHASRIFTKDYETLVLSD